MIKYDELDDCLHFRQRFTFVDVEIHDDSYFICILGQFIYDGETVYIYFDPLLWNEDNFNFPKCSEVEITFALTTHNGFLINYPIGLQAI